MCEWVCNQHKMTHDDDQRTDSEICSLASNCVFLYDLGFACRWAWHLFLCTPHLLLNSAFLANKLLFTLAATILKLFCGHLPVAIIAYTWTNPNCNSVSIFGTKLKIPANLTANQTAIDDNNFQTSKYFCSLLWFCFLKITTGILSKYCG